MPQNRVSRNVVLTGGVQTGGLVDRSIRLRIDPTATVGAERDTGFDLPVGAVLKDVYLDINVGESGASAGIRTLSVGLLSSEAGGVTNGFLSSVSTATNGIYSGIQGLSATSGAFGSLLMEVTTVSANVRRDHIVRPGQAQSVAYTLNSIHSTLDANLVLRWVEPT